jgi:GMP synthase PP-ATPase subunit
MIPRDQLEELDGLLAAVRTAGVTGMSRSKLVRIALRVVSTEAVIALARRAR